MPYYLLFVSFDDFVGNTGVQSVVLQRLEDAKSRMNDCVSSIEEKFEIDDLYKTLVSNFYRQENNSHKLKTSIVSYELYYWILVEFKEPAAQESLYLTLSLVDTSIETCKVFPWQQAKKHVIENVLHCYGSEIEKKTIILSDAIGEEKPSTFLNVNEVFDYQDEGVHAWIMIKIN